jgi:threonylcarbamoyladenosine tRNA methylthiotransferase MtaB
MNQFPKVAFHTLGCKLNFSETSTIARQFADAGYARVESGEQPDVLVINTCSVTDQADKKCRNIVSRAIRENPGVYVAVIGCYAQLKPEEIAAIPGVDIVLGAQEKFNILDHIQQKKSDSTTILNTEIRDVKQFIPSYSSGDRTRTFLKVQDGCNYFCAFCTIPLARGRSRSASIERTMDEARKAIAAGAREIVLTGVNIGDFGTAQGESFLSLIQSLDQLEHIDRFRISSIEPNLLSDEIIDFVARSQKFLPHFHIPLQSGNDEVLAAMRRRYRSDLYRSRIERIQSLLPNACIGADIITGFPGETDDHFNQSMEFISSIDLSYLHVFTYSEREDTTALRISEVVPTATRQQRTHQLRILSDKLRNKFYRRFHNTIASVLWEGENNNGWISGFTENYLRVVKPWNEGSVNQIENVMLTSLNSDGDFMCSIAP